MQCGTNAVPSAVPEYVPFFFVAVDIRAVDVAVADLDGVGYCFADFAFVGLPGSFSEILAKVIFWWGKKVVYV